MSKPEVIGDWLSACITHCHRGCLVTIFHFNPQISHNGSWIRTCSTWYVYYLQLCSFKNLICFSRSMVQLLSIQGLGEGLLDDCFMENWRFRIKNTGSDSYLYMFIMIQGGTDLLSAVLSQYLKKYCERNCKFLKRSSCHVSVTWILGNAMFWFKF